MFSLFTIVNFKNFGCQSNDALNNGYVVTPKTYINPTVTYYSKNEHGILQNLARPIFATGRVTQRQSALTEGEGLKVDALRGK